MKKIVVITGLTGTGKSALAVKVAKSFDGEIISADSVQIYKGLDIGSAKVSKEDRKSVAHHLIDIVEPNETYNVGQFVLDCQKAIEEIERRGKIPIIVGGTGLYIKALIEGFTLGNTASHDEFREKYTNLAKVKGNDYVWNILKSKNPDKANSVHPNNIKRVIRYLEIEEFGDFKEKSTSILSGHEVLPLAIIEEREIIYKKINERVDEMLRLGLLDEVLTLKEQGAEESWQSMQAIGYKEWFSYFSGENSQEDVINLIKQHSRNYCKRQLTFLKTIKGLKFCSIKEAEQLIKEFL